RTMRHARARRGHRFAFALRKMDAVREHRARAEQAALFVNIGVIFRSRELVPHLLDLLEIFREMRLHVSLALLRQLRRAAHALLAATRSEARAERIVDQPV